MKFRLSMASQLGASARAYPSRLNPCDVENERGVPYVIGEVDSLDQLMGIANSVPEYAGLLIFGSGPEGTEMPELMIYDDYIE